MVVSLCVTVLFSKDRLRKLLGSRRKDIQGKENSQPDFCILESRQVESVGRGWLKKQAGVSSSSTFRVSVGSWPGAVGE